MYSNRTRSGQKRLLNTRGVRDLREVLDQKRSEKECAQGDQQQQPPPDPSFNYLKDPSREQNDRRNPKSNNKQYYKTKHFTQSWQNRPNFQQRQHQQQQNQDIENPCNIKIEFSTSSGQHTYTLDENVKLPTIKHVPDRKIYPVRRNNYEWQRGGRQHFTNNRKYQSSNTNKSRKNDKNDNNSVDELTTKTVDASQDSTETEIVQQLENICLNHDDEEVDGEEEVEAEEEEEGEEEKEVVEEEEDEGEVDKNEEQTVEKCENVKEGNVDTKNDNSK